MNDLEKIMNEELELDENIFAAAKKGAQAVGQGFKNAASSMKKNFQRGMDLSKSVNAHVKDFQRKADTAADNAMNKVNAKTDALNNKEVQARKQMNKYKLEYMKYVKGLLDAYEASEGEDVKEKLADTKVQQYLKYLKTTWEYMEKVSDSLNEAFDDKPFLKAAWQSLNNSVQQFWGKDKESGYDYREETFFDEIIKSIKEKYDKVANALNKAYKKKVVEPINPTESSEKDAGDVTADDAKGGSSDSGDITAADAKGGKKDDPYDAWVKIYDDDSRLENATNDVYGGDLAKDLINFKRLFDTAKTESFIHKMAVMIVEEVSRADLDIAKRLVYSYEIASKDPKNGDNIGRVLVRLAKTKDVKGMIDKFKENLSDEERAYFDSVKVEPKEDKKKQDKPAEDSTKESSDKLISNVTDGLKSMGFDVKQAAELVKKITAKYPDFNDADLMQAAIVVLSGEISGDKTVKIKGKEYKVSELTESRLYEMAIKNTDEIVDKFSKTYKKIKAKAGKTSSLVADGKAAAIKKKIAVLQDKYNKSTNQQKFREYVNRALKTIGITPKDSKMGINATKVLNWLNIAKNSSLKSESLNIEFELYKEDIVDILWKNRNILDA